MVPGTCTSLSHMHSCCSHTYVPTYSWSTACAVRKMAAGHWKGKKHAFLYHEDQATGRARQRGVSSLLAFHFVIFFSLQIWHITINLGNHFSVHEQLPYTACNIRKPTQPPSLRHATRFSTGNSCLCRSCLACFHPYLEIKAPRRVALRQITWRNELPHQERIEMATS